ncbi:MAG: ATP-dependent DNA ligase, partial [Gammaproteobacteria bacterium]|nr:ATP-dependent DNA ligase [Gammaproteobacteria bacterium]NIR95218.1 ATP-dependent DNA ligase [Gammaproteobacteria bacterium]
MPKMKFGQYRFEVADRDKILFPEIRLSKGDLIDYYVQIAEVMLPHISGRPLNLQRFPDGIEKEGFFQQQR